MNQTSLFENEHFVEGLAPIDVREGVKPDLSVAILLWPMFTLSAFAGFVDALRLAGDVGDRSRKVHCSWTVMAPNTHPISSSCGLSVNPDRLLKDPSHFDYVGVVGGLTKGFDRADPELVRYVRHAAEARVPLIGLCTGVIVLAQMGLMRNRRCCVAAYHYHDLADTVPDAVPVCDRLFVDDGDRITCAGGLASIDLAAHLIKRHCGMDRAAKLVRTMFIDHPRPAEHAQHYLGMDSQRVADPRLNRALFLMEQNISDPIPVHALARAINVSERQLERLFHAAFGLTPGLYYRRVRLRHGHWLLANTSYSIAQVAFECGFSDASHFARCFRAEFASLPSAVRRKQLPTGK